MTNGGGNKKRIESHSVYILEGIGVGASVAIGVGAAVGIDDEESVGCGVAKRGKSECCRHCCVSL